MQTGQKICLLASFLGSFAFYSHCSYPSVTPGDGGELITAAYRLGISHPPSYPIHSLIGKTFLFLMPFGSPAYKLNIMSSLFGALTVGTAFFVAYHCLMFPIEIALGCAFVLSISPALIFNCSQTDVFTIHSFLFLLLLGFVLHSSHGVNQAYLSGFLLGLGIAAHQITLLSIPGIGVILWNRIKVYRLKVNILLLVFTLLLGTTVYFYALARADSRPIPNWGNPKTFGNFTQMLMRKQYGTLSLAAGIDGSRRTDGFFHNFDEMFISIFGRGSSPYIYTIVLLTLLLFAIKHIGIRRSGFQFAGLFFVFLLTGPLFLLLARPPASGQYVEILQRFYLAPAISGIFLIGININHLAANFGRWRLVPVAVILFSSLFCNLNALSATLGNRRNFMTHDFAHSILKTIPPAASVYISRKIGPDFTFPVLYLQKVLGKREDVAMTDSNIYNYSEESKLLLSLKNTAVLKKTMLSISRQKPFLIATTDMEEFAFPLMNHGFMFALPDPLGETKGFSQTSDLAIIRVPEHLTFAERSIQARILYFYSLSSFLNGDLEKGKRNMEIASLLVHDAPSAQLVLAKALWMNRNYEMAITVLNRSLQSDSSFTEANFYLGLVYESMGRFEDAIEHYSKVPSGDSKYLSALINMGSCHAKQGKYNLALETFERAHALDAKNQEILAKMERLRKILKRN